MSRSLKSALASILPVLIIRKDRFASLNQEKIDLFDFAWRKFGIKSFADLGGVWKVDGGYTFYALYNYPIERALLVDTDFTEKVFQRAGSFPALKLIQGNFGSEEVAQKIGSVDAVMFFDTLLHQVDPDWDQVLEMYAWRAKYFLIFNQQFTASETTVRLLDLPEDEYFNNVEVDKKQDPYKELYRRLSEIHLQHKRPYRDIHNIWQWGITDVDLIAKMKGLGFELQSYKNVGTFGGWKNFENHAFVFSRRAMTK